MGRRAAAWRPAGLRYCDGRSAAFGGCLLASRFFPNPFHLWIGGERFAHLLDRAVLAPTVFAALRVAGVVAFGAWPVERARWIVQRDPTVRAVVRAGGCLTTVSTGALAASLTLTALMIELRVEPLFAARGGGASFVACTFGRGVTTCIAAAAAAAAAAAVPEAARAAAAAAAATLGEDMDVNKALCRLRTLSVLAPLSSPSVCVRLEPILAL